MQNKTAKRLQRKSKKSTTKKIVWLCLINGLLWVWCSYALAIYGAIFGSSYLQIAESLSQIAITEIIGVVLVYCLKSLFEKRNDFGGVGGNKPTETEER